MNKTEIKKYIKSICITAKYAAMSARSLTNTQRIMIIKKIIKNIKDSKNIIIRKNSNSWLSFNDLFSIIMNNNT